MFAVDNPSLVTSSSLSVIGIGSALPFFLQWFPLRPEIFSSPSLQLHFVRNIILYINLYMHLVIGGHVFILHARLTWQYIKDIMKFIVGSRLKFLHCQGDYKLKFGIGEENEGTARRM